MNIWGTGRWCDFRCRSDAEMRAVIDLAHANGGLCSINHPKQGGPAWEYDVICPWTPWRSGRGPGPGATKRAWLCGRARSWRVGGYRRGRQRLSLSRWRGDRLSTPGSTHHLGKGDGAQCGCGAGCIRAGRVSISAAPDGPRLDLRAVAGGATAGMGRLLPPDVPIQAEVHVERGAGWMLRLIADGLAHETSIMAAEATVRVPVTAHTTCVPSWSAMPHAS